jgi:hypothetical protein
VSVADDQRTSRREAVDAAKRAIAAWLEVLGDAFEVEVA